MTVYELSGNPVRRSVLVLIVALVAVFIVFVLSGALEANRATAAAEESAAHGFAGWLQLVIPAEADDLTIVERLTESGAGTAISRSSVTVTVTTIDTVERVRSTRAKERLLDRDPRKDRFVRHVDALFNARWDGVPAQLVYVRNHSGGVGEWLSQYVSTIEAAGVGRNELAVVDELGAVHRPGSVEGRMRPAHAAGLVGLLFAVAALGLAVIEVRRVGGLRDRKVSRGGGEAFVPTVCLGVAAILAASVALHTEVRSVPEGWQLRVKVPAAAGESRGGNPAEAVDPTREPELTAGSAHRLYNRARADWEAAPEPEIPHFGSVLAHLAFQHGLAWGRGYEPPRYDERVFRPTADPSAIAQSDVDEHTVIHFDERWLASAIGPDGLPVAQLLAQSAGRAPITLKEATPNKPRYERLHAVVAVVGVVAGAAMVLSGVTRLQVR